MSPTTELARIMEGEDMWEKELDLARNEYLKASGSVDRKLYYVQEGSLRYGGVYYAPLNKSIGCANDFKHSTMPITIDVKQGYLYNKGRGEGREEEYKLIYLKMHAAGFTALEIRDLLGRSLADVTAIITASETAAAQSKSEI